MDIEAENRKTLSDSLGSGFSVLEECGLELVGFGQTLRADVVAISKDPLEPWILAFEVKVPTERWELSHWLNAIRQAANYSNSKVADDRAKGKNGCTVNASFLFPAPLLAPWRKVDGQGTRFFRKHDLEPLRGALLLAQHFRVGSALIPQDHRDKSELKLGTDPVWDDRLGWREKSHNLLGKRKIGSHQRMLKNA